MPAAYDLNHSKYTVQKITNEEPVYYRENRRKRGHRKTTVNTCMYTIQESGCQGQNQIRLEVQEIESCGSL